ncbi:hypothetical protein AXF42_Ash008717 [Apostasia shenzhenica]|uniref:Uncharacterized protein n=1 Tax=Apostasia shenzhenica TaxID=1088818 RepID=A0A2I0B261_9ASPA|nr:hypothetical protein AXF42_Ash008717 [Apostasia shenzhenica]
MIFLVIFMSCFSSSFCSPCMKGIETTCPIGNSISHDVRCEESNANVEQGSCTNMKEIVEDKFQELCDNEDSSDGGKEIGTVTDGVLYVQNSHDRFPRENKVSNPDGISICEEPGCSNSFGATVLKCLSKSATFPSYEVDSSHSNLETFAPVQDSSEDYVPEYKRSLSIPVRPSKLVSAMKGGRVQNRTLPKMDMHVKWAADVYDPPSTLVSHTVKNNYHHCPKPKKKNTYKHNHKGKSSPGKKLQNRKNGGSISEPYAARYFLRLVANSFKIMASYLVCPVLSLLLLKNLNILIRFKVSPCNEAAESSTDSKCGSIVFLRESLANFHLSIGEAT